MRDKLLYFEFFLSAMLRQLVPTIKNEQGERDEVYDMKFVLLKMILRNGFYFLASDLRDLSTVILRGF